MCGILFLIGDGSINYINNRGPDETICGNDMYASWMFYRLAITGQQKASFIENDEWLLLCNGEVYTQKYTLNETHKSDCEFILIEFMKNGIEGVKELLVNSEFALILYNKKTHKHITLRDRFGIRPLFEIITKSGGVCYASEIKYINDPISIKQVECMEYSDFTSLKQANSIKNYLTLTDKSNLLFNSLVLSVQDRMHNNMAFLLSGGMDSSIICAIAAMLLNNKKRIYTFAIGTDYNSTDLIAAREVAKYINSIHYEAVCSNEDFYNAIEETIYFEETFDTTTIRAGVGMNLIAKKIKKMGFRVVMTGEGSDELFGSYRYFLNAPSAIDHVEETKRLLKDIKYFDVLRCDRTISNNGLEARVPFLDSRVVDTVHKYFNNEDYLPKHGLMKFILRNVAKIHNLLPESIYKRPKEAFSDGVSPNGQNWWDGIDESIYEVIYRKYFGYVYEPTPYKWLPRWCGNKNDPSARILNIKEESDNNF